MHENISCVDACVLVVRHVTADKIAERWNICLPVGCETTECSSKKCQKAM
jgi:hypothetical protein